MKQELQKELKEKVREGIKPSDLKKLKRSKSAGDIPKVPPLPNSVPVSRSKSNSFNDPKYPYTTLIAQQEELEQLRKEIQRITELLNKSESQTKTKSETIALLRKKNESLEQELNKTKGNNIQFYSE